jgi:hypothetical protein
MLCASSKPSELALPVIDPTKASRRRYYLPVKLILRESTKWLQFEEATRNQRISKNIFQADQLNSYHDRERGERVLEERMAADHAADTEAPVHNAED